MLPDGQHFLVNPFGLHFSEITASNLIVCDFSGKVIRGEGEPSASAHHIHAPIHLKNGFWIMPVAYIGADG
ncbi:hypothetical protein CRENPOLYSF2_420016 [Crenothrix polyspora]|uniref:Class II aldolase/adducin N-terminal domain-containing protein n=1 Tax=Crenothrix polyspora TaxID=360316 RepID=A0A1R4HEQ5_9GAMM|nr:hypothetical protein CRENPOLYSF2_420016 [Crenothrix polyspora]